MLRRNYRCLFLYGLNMGTGTRINLVNKSVSRETPMLAANGLTPIGNERMSGDCLLPALLPDAFLVG